jgi:L-asparaginase II
VSPNRPGRDSVAGAVTSRHVRRPARRHEAAKPPPVLVVERRGDVVESRHRGSIVQVGSDGTPLRAVGDPDVMVNLRSAVKPFGLVAFVEAGGVEAFDLSTTELAIMAGSHSGEDMHVRTLQAVLRRAGISQNALGCGADGAPLDAITATRLARDGEKPGQVRHMCSGQHTSILLLCKLNDWPLEEYWRPDHPVQRLYAETVAHVFGTSAALLITSTDACGVPTYAFPLSEVARAFAFLADPSAVRPSDSRFGLAGPLTRVRDAMLAGPEMVAGTRERLDTAVMTAAPGRIVAKGGAEGLRGFGLLPGTVGGGAPASGVAIKIEDGAGFARATSAASVEALRQLGALDSAALSALSHYRRPVGLDPRGEPAAGAEADFTLAPLGELIG